MHVATEAAYSASQVQVLEALRRRYAQEVRYPWLTRPELRRLDFWRYYRALHGRPRDPVLSPEAQALGRCVEFYLTGYSRGRKS